MTEEKPKKEEKVIEEIKKEIIENPEEKKVEETDKEKEEVLIDELKKNETEEEVLKKPERSDKRRYFREREKEIWVPKTRLGKKVKAGQIKDINEIFDEKLQILEPEIVEALLSLQSELLAIGQAKGKFGGGKKRMQRQTQKKTAEGNVPSFTCMAVAGDGNGHVGVGVGKARETLPAKEKSIRHAKLNIIQIKRGCGSFDCGCKEKHSIPFKVSGKSGSARITLIPAPKGTGLAIEDECKKVLNVAGIKDIYSKTFGQTKTKFNLIKACFQALEKTTKLKE